MVDTLPSRLSSSLPNEYVTAISRFDRRDLSIGTGDRVIIIEATGP